MIRFAACTVLGVISVASPAFSLESQSIPENPVQPERQIQQLEASSSTRQQVSGNVTAIDAGTGVVTLASAAGTLSLQFPPATLRGMHTGDPITAEYAFAKGNASLRAYDAPRGAGENQVLGTVEDVNHDTGWIRVKSDRASLQLAFPPNAVRDLKTGDRITVDLAFTKMIPPRTD